MRYKKHLLSMSIALALGASGSAFAVNNGGFELPFGPSGTVPINWTTTNDAAAGQSQAIIAPHGGNWHLIMGWFSNIGSGGSVFATGTAGEDLTECSPYDLGEWAAAGWYHTEDADTASFRVDFDDGTFETTGGLTHTDQDGWAEVTDSGNIGEMATSATVTVGGTDSDGDGYALAMWDDISFTADCVTDYAKISGKFKVPTQDLEASNGVFQRGWVSFDGAFGHLESGKLVGDLSWNDKLVRVTCDAVPDPADFYLYTVPAPNDDYEAAYAITYSCSDGTDGKALFFFDVDGGSSHGGKNKDKFDRGCWKLSNYETEGSPDFFELYSCLEKGNVDVMPPPAP